MTCLLSFSGLFDCIYHTQLETNRATPDHLLARLPPDLQTGHFWIRLSRWICEEPDSCSEQVLQAGSDVTHVESGWTCQVDVADGTMWRIRLDSTVSQFTRSLTWQLSEINIK